MLCQSMMPHDMLVILNKNEGMLVKITSTIEGGAFFGKTCRLSYMISEIKNVASKLIAMVDISGES